MAKRSVEAGLRCAKQCSGHLIVGGLAVHAYG
jgi:hypothetical protein